MGKKLREFVDCNRDVIMEYYDLCEAREDGEAMESIKRRITRLIAKDPDFLDTYLFLYEALVDEGKQEEADKVLDDAYKRALKLITDKDGRWPDVMEWGCLENRHIIRTLVNKGVERWQKNDTENALLIFRNVLKTNPGDNPGVRDFILAIRMKLSYDDFESRFNRGGFYDNKLTDWFEKNHNKFPDEFAWWDEEIERRERE